MSAVGRLMPDSLLETGEGGLAATGTGRKIAGGLGQEDRAGTDR